MTSPLANPLPPPCHFVSPFGEPPPPLVGGDVLYGRPLTVFGHVHNSTPNVPIFHYKNRRSGKKKIILVSKKINIGKFKIAQLISISPSRLLSTFRKHILHFDFDNTIVLIYKHMYFNIISKKTLINTFSFQI